MPFTAERRKEVDTTAWTKPLRKQTIGACGVSGCLLRSGCPLPRLPWLWVGATKRSIASPVCQHTAPLAKHACANASFFEVREPCLDLPEIFLPPECTPAVCIGCLSHARAALLT